MTMPVLAQREESNQVFDDFYNQKRILVTGVAGVKGTWLALALLEAGATVTGIDIKAPEEYSNFAASGLGNRLKFVLGDVNDLSLLKDLIDEADGIFHLAAVTLVKDSFKNPFEAYRTNTMGTLTVLEAIRQSRNRKYAVFVTTDKVYKPKNNELWVETDPLGASGPYPVSKACCELVIADYLRTYLGPDGHLAGIARAGNVLIGGDLHSSRTTGGGGRIFVDCYDALSRNQAPEIYSPGFTRPYTYGLDIIAGYMTLMSKLDEPGITGEAFNFGPYEQFGIPNRLLATKICELWGGKIMWRSGEAREEPFELQSLSIEKSRRVLHWQPAFTLHEALQATTRWYKAWSLVEPNGWAGSMYTLNLELLAEHRSAARNLGIEWATRPRSISAKAM